MQMSTSTSPFIRLTRRSFTGALAATGLLLGAGQQTGATRLAGMSRRLATAQDAPDGPFTLPELPYAYDALEPHIDLLTMQIHHDKHHAAYVANLNKAIDGKSDLQAMTVEQLVSGLDALPEEIRTAVRNNAGGHLNHSLFWDAMGRDTSEPGGDLAAAIDGDFGGLDALQAAVNDGGMKRFGSGWSWLVVKDGALAVVSTPNQDSPLTDGSGTPILGVDVWEHAYYLKYQNLRADYLAAWWNVVNWNVVAERYAAAIGG
jgi:Fe-Mn family superoxide dismutase